MGARIVFRLLMVALAACLTLSLIPPAGLAAARQPVPDSIAVTLRAPLARQAAQATAADLLAMPGFEPAARPGLPALPVRLVEIALPPDADLASVQVTNLRVERAALPAGLAFDLAPQPSADGFVSAAPASEAGEPLPVVSIVASGQMRKWRFVRLLYSPVQDGWLAGEVRLEITFTRTALPERDALLGDTLMDAQAAARFANFTQAQAWYPHPDLDDDRPVGYVIVTSNRVQAGSQALPEFVAHLHQRGFAVTVITEDDFGPLDPDWRITTANIRAWLAANYLSDNLLYVLLLGFPSTNESYEVGEIPMVDCFPRQHFDQYREMRTDYPYADLTGNWDLDGDGVCGEYPEDGEPGGVDFAAELFVGRIIVDEWEGWVQRLDKTLRKIIAYEQETGSDPAWRRTALLAMSITSPFSDNAGLGEALRSSVFTPLEIEPETFYMHRAEGCTSTLPSTHELSYRSLMQHWIDEPTGWVSWTAHGDDLSIVVGFPDSNYDCYDSAIIDRMGLIQLDDSRPAVVFSGSCKTLFYIGRDMLRNGAVGVFTSEGVVWVSAAMPGWEPSWQSANVNDLDYFIAQRTQSGQPLGIALYDVKAEMGTAWGSNSWQNLMGFNLLGSPATVMYPPLTPDAPAASTAAPAGMGSIELHWSDLSDDEDGFEVERSALGEDWALIATLPPGTESYLDTGLPPGQTFAYRVRAFNAYGYSDYTAPVSVDTPFFVQIPLIAR